MSASIVQMDSAALSSGALTSTFFENSFGFKAIAEGDAVVLLTETVGQPNVTSVTDNYGNTWTQVPGAHAADSEGNNATDIWVAYNVAASSGVAPDQLSITVHLDRGGYGVNAAVYHVTGINDSTVVAGIATILGAGSTGTGPSLNGGSGALFIANLGTTNGHLATVASPWSIFSSLTGAPAGSQNCASLISSGTQQPVFTLNNSGFDVDISVVAFISGGGSSSEPPFLGSVTEVDSAPAGDSSGFIGTVTVIESAPAGELNPYLGRIKSGSPAPGQSNPALGKVVIVVSAPAGESDPFLGSFEKA